MMLTDDQVLNDWNGLQRRQATEMARRVTEYCLGRSMQKVGNLLDRQRQWVRHQLDHASLAGSKPSLNIGGKSHSNPIAQVKAIFQEYAPAEADPDRAETFEAMGHTPEVANRLAVGQECREIALTHGAIQEDDDRASKLVLPDDLEWHTRLTKAMSEVKHAAKLLDEANMADLRLCQNEGESCRSAQQMDGTGGTSCEFTPHVLRKDCGMKRTEKELQGRLDRQLLHAIENGVRGHRQLKNEVKQLLFDPEVRFGDLLNHAIDRMLGTEASATKQRLQAEGHIVIGKNNRALLAKEAGPSDWEFIIEREEATDVGRLKSRALQCHAVGMHEEFAKILRALGCLSDKAAGEVQTEIAEREAAANSS